ncbi:hypothetical protein, conserved [Leishmania tarentolae]|uniref:Uncharacterized protein n=1 Tax=Leishmania tarentolae TaxID=5689 RepID=A0A640KWB6_LEITA|nr:hypothetical protein, conserved [Leishmania tarentolae]
MLARTPFRFWTPQYFRGQVGAGRQLSKRRVRALGAAPTNCSAGATKAGETVTLGTISTRTPPPEKPFRKLPTDGAPSSLSAGQNLDRPRNSGLHSPPTDTFHASNPLVQRAEELLHELPTVGRSKSLLFPDAVKGYVEFSARRDVFGPLRGLLPPPAMSSGGISANPAARQRFRVVPVTSGDDVLFPDSPQMTAAGNFSISELVLFLRLYDSTNIEDGQLLVQMMSEIRRQLFSLAEAAADAAVTTAGSSTPSVGSSTTNEDDGEGQSRCVKGISQAPGGSLLPLPAMLYTMSSLGIVEEDVLDVVTSCAMYNGTRRRRGLLYSQLCFYSVADLLQLLVALHRFGHQQHSSTKTVTKALRASLYSSSTTASRFHRHVKLLKKMIQSQSRAPSPGEGRISGAATDADTAGIASMIAADEELRSLAFGLECPLFLLLEALTTTSTTVHRRADVVAFLSDLIAVTAVAELTTAVQESRDSHSHAGFKDLEREAQEFVLAVSHQLLRAAKLTECMELPQILLSHVFAWSTTLSGRGVVVDGGEDSTFPSDRVVYYDHVTADLIKANSAE